MIGNDIIDLDLARKQNKSEDERYLKKVFTNTEIKDILDSEVPEIRLWTYWAMKETAYKAHQRIFRMARKLNPLAFQGELDASGKTGLVRIKNEEYPVGLDSSEDYIYGYTNSESCFQKIYASGPEPRESFLNHLCAENDLQRSDISYAKDELGIPFLYIKSKENKLPLSISHHGRFTAFMIALIKS